MNHEPPIPPAFDVSFAGDPSPVEPFDDIPPLYEDELQLPGRDGHQHTGAWDPEDDHELLGAEEAALHIEPEL